MNVEVIKNRNLKYRLENQEYFKQYKKDWYLKNKVRLLKEQHDYYSKHKNAIASYHKQYREEHKEELFLKDKQRRQKNRIQENQKIKERRANDINFNLKLLLRARINLALKNSQKSGHTLDLLGCSIEEFKHYLKSKFKPGMNWSNHNLHGWHIDHKIPCYMFDLSNPEEQRKCFHYTNLQPMWAKDNLRKNGRDKKSREQYGQSSSKRI